MVSKLMNTERLSELISLTNTVGGHRQSGRSKSARSETLHHISSRHKTITAGALLPLPQTARLLHELLAGSPAVGSRKRHRKQQHGPAVAGDARSSCSVVLHNILSSQQQLLLSAAMYTHVHTIVGWKSFRSRQLCIPSWRAAPQTYYPCPVVNVVR